LLGIPQASSVDKFGRLSISKEKKKEKCGAFLTKEAQKKYHVRRTSAYGGFHTKRLQILLDGTVKTLTMEVQR